MNMSPTFNENENKPNLATMIARMPSPSDEHKYVDEFEDEFELPLGWIKMTDSDGDYYYNMFSSEEQREPPTDEAMPKLIKSKAIFMSLPPSHTKASSIPLPLMEPLIPHHGIEKDRSKSTDLLATDGITKFNRILQISDNNKLETVDGG